MPEAERPVRADVRRNRARIMAAAGELFARQGRDAQMDDIAERAGVGLGTLYRHFPSKQALLTAMVRERFRGMTEIARDAEAVADPGTAFETLLRRYADAADGDATFQLALMGSADLDAAGLEEQKAEFAAIVTRVLDRAVAAGAVRADLTFADFPMLTGALLATMYFRPAGGRDWRRHLDLLLHGVRAAGT